MDGGDEKAVDDTTDAIGYEYFLSRDVTLNVRVKISLLDLGGVSELHWLGAGADSLSEMTVTVQIYADGLPLHTVPIGTHTHGRDTVGHGRHIYWGEWIVLPVKYRDLSRNAKLAITVWSVTDRPVGGATLSFFDQKGAMRSGLQKLLLWDGLEADETSTCGQINDTADECFRLQKVKERYDRG